MPASSLLPTAQTGCRSLDRNQKQLRLTTVIVAARLPKEHGSLVCGSRSKVGPGSLAQMCRLAGAVVWFGEASSLGGQRGRFHQRDHRPAAIRHSPIWAIGVNLVPLLLGFFEATSPNDAAACRVRLHGVRQRGCMRKAKDRLQHLNDVLEGVLVVIQDDDVVELASFVFRRLTGLGLYYASWHCF